MIVPEAAVLLSESSFTEIVPLSSTFQEPAEVWAERARVKRIADQVEADKARLEKSTASLKRAQEATALSSTRLPRSDLGAHTKTSEKQLMFRSEDVPTEDYEVSGGDRAHSRRGAVWVKADKRGTV